MQINRYYDLLTADEEFGIEIEVEGENLPVGRTFNNTYWRVVADTSLRGESAEYVLRRPVNADKIIVALDQLQAKFLANGAIFHPSYRAGIHVHLNVQNLTFRQITNYVVTYLIFEEILVKWCGETREGNHFCLRSSDAHYFIDCLSSALKDDNPKNLSADHIRYFNVNLSSISKHGSVEFRALESTLDKNRIYSWCNILKKLKDYSLKYKNAQDIVRQVSLQGYSEFMKNVFEEEYENFLCEDFQQKIREGITNAQDVAFAIKWDEFTLDIFKQKKIYFS